MSTILLVDDDQRILDGLKRMIRRSPLEAVCEVAIDGREALDRVFSRDVDVVVTDVGMPVVDGIELLTRLKADPATQHIPVIILTGHDEVAIRRAALDLGAFDFLVKPADSTELTARLRNALRIKAYQDELRTRNDLLERQLVQLQQLENTAFLASGVVHDLNNALGCTVGHIELLQHDIGAEHPARKHLRAIVQAVEQMQGLVQSIHALNRRDPAVLQSCDVSGIIEETLSVLRVSVEGRVDLQWRRPAEECRIMGDPTELRQLVMNLTINAVQAIHGEGAVRISLAPVELDESRPQRLDHLAPGAYVCLKVFDTGIGIKQELVDRVFEPLFTTKPEGQGTGLGLSVVSRTAEHHGGMVVVDSTEDAGTTFTVYLPCAANLASEHDSGGEICHVGEEKHPVRR